MRDVDANRIDSLEGRGILLKYLLKAFEIVSGTVMTSSLMISESE